MNIDWSKLKTAEHLHQEEQDRKAASIRAERNRLLAETDYMVLPDSVNNSSEIKVYRQALRDLTKQSTFPEEVVFPTKPE